MANMEKLNQTLRYIRTHFELWDQTTWFKPLGQNEEFTPRQIVDMILEDPYDPVCGVTGCMAGLAAFQNGYVPIFHVVNADSDWAEVNPGEYVAPRDPNTGQVLSDQQLRTKEAAAKVFDIDGTTASRLFDSENSFETLQEMVAYIGEHGNLNYFQGSASESTCSCGDPTCGVDDDYFEDEDDYDDEDSIF